MGLALAITGCRSLAPEQWPAVGPALARAGLCARGWVPRDADDAARFLIEAHSWADWARRQQTERTAIEPSSRCAAIAFRAMGAADRAIERKPRRWQRIAPTPSSGWRCKGRHDAGPRGRPASAASE